MLDARLFSRENETGRGDEICLRSPGWNSNAGLFDCKAALSSTLLPWPWLSYKWDWCTPSLLTFVGPGRGAGVSAEGLGWLQISHRLVLCVLEQLPWKKQGPRAYPRGGQLQDSIRAAGALFKSLPPLDRALRAVKGWTGELLL